MTMNVRTANKSKKLEVLLWSIAFPGFGQLLNHAYLKGFLLIGLEVIINIMGNFNEVIILSFNGQIQEAIEQTNYSWLMFYPCLYFFSIWDAYKDVSGGINKPFSYLPFAFAAYFVTLGLIFSKSFTPNGILIGPIWLPILFLPIGLVAGIAIQNFLVKLNSSKSNGAS